MKRPSFDELPLRRGDPPFSAWGLYGDDDELGTLNLLTPDVVQKAATEIKTGVRIGLNLPLDYLGQPSHNRTGLTHNVIWKKPRAVFDDVIEMNTQLGAVRGSSAVVFCSTIFAGVNLTVWIMIQKPYTQTDFPYDYAIKVEDLQACAKDQNVTLKHGDILFVRSGFKVGYDSLTEEQKISWSVADPTKWVGVEASVGLLRWLWESGISACAGDSPSWESVPFTGSPCMHEVMLAGWGMPIGEFLDLERLSEECLKQNRYSFFMTSMPLYLKGGVGSPPNIVAIL